MHIASRILFGLFGGGVALLFLASNTGRGAAWKETVIGIVPLTALVLLFWLFTLLFPPGRIKNDPVALPIWRKRAGLLMSVLGIVYFASIGMGSAINCKERRSDALSAAASARAEARRRRMQDLRSRSYSDSYDPYGYKSPRSYQPPPYQPYNDGGALEEAYARDDELGLGLSVLFAGLAIFPLIGVIVSAVRSNKPLQGFPQPGYGPGYAYPPGYGPPGYPPGAYPQPGYAPPGYAPPGYAPPQAPAFQAQQGPESAQSPPPQGPGNPSARG